MKGKTKKGIMTRICLVSAESRYPKIIPSLPRSGGGAVTFRVHINTAKLITRSQVLNIVPSIDGEFKQESTS